MKKKIGLLLALAMTIVMGVGATACHIGGEVSSSSDSSTPADNSTPDASTPEDSSTPDASEDIVVNDKTVATIAKADEATLAEWNATNIEFYNVAGEYATLEVGYTFSAKETVEEAKASEYADWLADYYVSVDTAIEDGKLGLAGSYQAWDNGKWLAFYAPAMEAGEAMGLLTNVNIKWTYAEIVEYVIDFKCGAFDLENACNGVTLTVELRLTNPDNASDYVVVNSTSYTFA